MKARMLVCIACAFALAGFINHCEAIPTFANLLTVAGETNAQVNLDPPAFAPFYIYVAASSSGRASRLAPGRPTGVSNYVQFVESYTGAPGKFTPNGLFVASVIGVSNVDCCVKAFYSTGTEDTHPRFSACSVSLIVIQPTTVLLLAAANSNAVNINFFGVPGTAAQVLSTNYGTYPNGGTIKAEAVTLGTGNYVIQETASIGGYTSPSANLLGVFVFSSFPDVARSDNSEIPVRDFEHVNIELPLASTGEQRSGGTAAGQVPGGTAGGAISGRTAPAASVTPVKATSAMPAKPSGQR